MNHFQLKIDKDRKFGLKTQKKCFSLKKLFKL